jgi:hypothetical protein
MLRQVIQGAGRLHYQAGSTRLCIARTSLSLRSFSATASQPLRFGGLNDKIRIFEQASKSSKKQVEIDPDAEDAEERQDLENELSKLDKELEDITKDPFAIDSPFIKSLPEKDRVIAIEAIRKYEAEHGHEDKDAPGLGQIFDQELDDMIKEEFEGLAKEEEETFDMSTPVSEPALSKGDDELSPMHPYEIRFRTHLQRVQIDPNKSNSQELWRWYQRCKDAVPSFLASLQPQTLQLLWKSQIQSQTPATRMTHVQALVEDFNSIERGLLPNEVLEFIDIIHDGGDTDRALQLWEDSQSIITRGEGDLHAYWSMGVRLFVASGDPQRAQDIAFAFLTGDGRRRDARVLIPIASAWTKQADSKADAKAWAIYLQLKTLLGFEMKMGDYDAVSTSFLKDGKIGLALAVFKDMMITGKDPSNDSTAIYQKALGFAGNLQTSSINADDVNRISLSTLTILPRRFQNKFFYASWMKKLIGMGEVDSAASVAELMFERGVKPDAIHLNGIIGGWLRNGSPSSRDKAERLGWSMIQHRIDTVWNRIQHPETSTKPAVPELPSDSRVPAFLKRTLPPANIETFSILLLHYSRRGDDDMVKYLNKCLSDAQTPPNSYYMNHLLYADLRKHYIHSLWEKFQYLSRQVSPDLETFACLWDCGKLQYDRSRTAYDINFPEVRQLFSIMMKWYSTLDARKMKAAQEEFSRELYDQITLCFCLSKDLCGTLVALYAMQRLFNFYPDDSTARMLVLQIARIANNNNTNNIPMGSSRRARARRRLSAAPQHKEQIEQIQNVLAVLQDRKAAMLQAQGLDVDQLDDHERQQYQLEILGDLLVSVIERTVDVDSGEGVKAPVASAVREMGVDGLGLQFLQEALH